MRRFAALVALAALLVTVTVTLRAATAAAIPDWAYAIPERGQPANPGAAPAGTPAAPDTTLRSAPGSSKQVPLNQINSATDWFPDDHPVPPAQIMTGPPNDAASACARCHYPNGKGRQESSSPAGLPASYILQTLEDFRHDVRKSAEPRKANTERMATIAKGLSQEDMRAVAAYFSSMKWTPWIRVVETSTVPKMFSRGGIWLPVEGAGAGKEPIGMRILETPENAEQTIVIRNPRSGNIAYVPTGSIKKGETLVKTGGAGKTVACGNCHGADLMGMGPVPGIAGRSPSYLGRQLYDMQAGTRHGEWTELMKPVVAKLTSEDLVNIVAYLSSRPVAPASQATN